MKLVSFQSTDEEFFNVLWIDVQRPLEIVEQEVIQEFPNGYYISDVSCLSPIPLSNTQSIIEVVEVANNFDVLHEQAVAAYCSEEE